MEKQENNKNLIGLFIILVILAIIFFGYYFYKNNSSGKIITDNTINKNIDEVGIKKINIDNLVNNVKDEYKNSAKFQECVGMDRSINLCLKDSVMDKIQEKKDVNICNDLIGDEDIQNCKNSFYIQQAEDAGNVSLCDKTTNKDYCLAQVYTKKALNSNDEGVCNSINQENQKQQCKYMIIRKKAVKENNSALCDKLIFTRTEGEGKNIIKIKDTSEVDMCKDEVKMQAEIKKNNEEMEKEMGKIIKDIAV